MAEPVDWQAFQYEIYFGGLSGQEPTLPLTYDGLVTRARDVLSDAAFGYVAGSAGLERTEGANRQAFDAWELVPRMLVDVTTRDLSTTLFDRELPAPVLCAPVGVQSIVHEEAELAAARAAAGLGLPFTCSTVSSFTLEQVAEACGDGPRWFQLYWPDDPEVAASLVHRAERAGYDAVVVTLDTKMLAWRPRDLATAYLPFLHGEGLANYFADEAFCAPLEQSPADDPQAAILRWASLFSNRAATWDDLETLRGLTDLPVLVKGILHPDDARRAVDTGVDGMVVSNHGGRQVDGAVGAVTALPGVVDAVEDEVPVLFDSGVRAGSDVVKALSLGAAAVLVGRPWVWGLAIAGEDGVRHVLRSLLAEVDLTMALCGAPTLADLGRHLFRHH
jgi:lactate 2-monooxygenase